ncbi:MAG: hypothetical protein H0V92_08665 [Pseudonocardiales bacterium]|nr:hypothetical protein [Pseudonocardiales bacterium]
MKRIDVEELRRLYDSAQCSIRWEGLQTYLVPWEDEDFAAWRRGDPSPPSERTDKYLTSLRERTDSGRRVVRVRGLRRPVTEYTHYEFEHGYAPHATAGQETVIVDLDEYPEFDGHDDFVVFDQDAVMWYRYDAECHLLGYDYSDDPEIVADRTALLEQMLAVAVPFTEVVL